MRRKSDFRSDTVTQPTERMKQAALSAELGDDVLRDDPTSRRLEELAAEVTGKQAALFVSSGTQGNLIALMVHCRPGDEVILDRDSHIVLNEQGGISRLAMSIPRTLPQTNGMMDPASIREAIRPDDIHAPRSRLICTENTHNRAGGTVVPIEYHWELNSLAEEKGLRSHIDGARIFNTSVASGIPVREYASTAGSITFCLSKGLCCPVGALLCGTTEFVEEARRIRKLLGGGMRQTGFLAASGIVALTEMVERLAEDHRRARILAEAIAGIPAFQIDLESVQTNILYFRSETAAAEDVIKALASEGVLCLALEGRIRMVTHHDVDDEDVQRAITALKKAALA